MYIYKNKQTNCVWLYLKGSEEILYAYWRRMEISFARGYDV